MMFAVYYRLCQTPVSLWVNDLSDFTAPPFSFLTYLSTLTLSIVASSLARGMETGLTSKCLMTFVFPLAIVTQVVPAGKKGVFILNKQDRGHG